MNFYVFLISIIVTNYFTTINYFIDLFNLTIHLNYINLIIIYFRHFIANDLITFIKLLKIDSINLVIIALMTFYLENYKGLKDFILFIS